ncbi:LOW QUALITY PROTEIN: serine/threonine-protein kinase Nek10 [Passerculus sandwichensis]
MPDQDKKLKSTAKAIKQKPSGISMRGYSDLKRLQSLLSVQSRNQQFPAIYIESGQTSVTRTWQNVKSDEQQSNGQCQASTEAVELEKFSVTYKNERNFSKHPKHQLFQDIFTTLVKDRLTCRQWVIQAPCMHFLRLLICLKLLIRDPCYQEMLHSLGGIENLGQYMETVANCYLNYKEEQRNVDKLVNMTYIFQTLAAVRNQREDITSGAHKTLVNLLFARDSYVVFGALLALTSLVECPECGEEISEIVENLLVILHEYDFLSNRFRTELLVLCAESRVKEQIKMYKGIPVLLSLLHSDCIKILWSIVWILVQVCEAPETTVEIRIWGRIKQLLHMLQEHLLTGRIRYLHLSDELSPDEIQENTFSLQAASCAAITELVLNEANAYQVVQANAIYTIAKLILSNKERNAEKASLLQENVLKQIAESTENMNNKAPTNRVGNDAILEHLGSGAFGSVCKVRKHNGQHLLAMKEVNLHNPAFGKDKNDRDSNVKNIVSELAIIKGQLYHPNVVWYYRTFLENDKLYIVMDLMEGVPLGDPFHYFKEKQQQFTEELWHIFILCLALRYLHKEKRIVHDLTVSNIMLEDKDKATIINPEVVKGELCGEKADVWAAGCILEQMATLGPPVYSTNVPSLATEIVGAVYEPVPEGLYSEKVSFTIKRECSSCGCLTPDAEARPDMLEITSLVPHVMMKYLEFLSTSHLMLEKKLDWERRQTQWYFMEANNAVTYHHQLPILSQAKYFMGKTLNDCCPRYKTNCLMQSRLALGSRGGHKDGSCGKLLEASTMFSRANPDGCEDGHDAGQSWASERLVFSLTDNEIDIVDNSSSSSSSNLEESAVGIIKQSFSVSERQPQIRIIRKTSQTFQLALAGIVESQGKVHQISDPVQQILVQLHKIIFTTKLPPALQCNLERRIVERFKKSLFSQKSNPCKLESEIKKVWYTIYYLCSNAAELIEPNIFTTDWHGVHLSSGGNMLLPDDRKGILGTSGMAEGMTYEQLQTLIEEVLEESGYYSFSSYRLLRFLGFSIMLIHQLSAGSTKIDPMPVAECATMWLKVAKHWSHPLEQQAVLLQGKKEWMKTGDAPHQTENESLCQRHGLNIEDSLPVPAAVLVDGKRLLTL